MKSRLESSLSRKGYRFIIGIDEAGRGPLAGPVVAAAVHLIDRRFHFPIRDSKIISARQRIEAFHEIHAKACVGVGIMNESIIDQQNILQATFLAMSRAVEELMVKLSTRQSEEVFDHQVMLLVDGNRFQSTLAYPYQTIVDGDASVLSIACASIVAKVVRDRILAIYDRVFPQYGFISHKGYPTQRHKEALKRYGPSVIHRRSFTLT